MVLTNQTQDSEWSFLILVKMLKGMVLKYLMIAKQSMDSTFQKDLNFQEKLLIHILIG